MISSGMTGRLASGKIMARHRSIQISLPEKGGRQAHSLPVIVSTRLAPIFNAGAVTDRAVRCEKDHRQSSHQSAMVSSALAGGRKTQHVYPEQAHAHPGIGEV
jgi:hypothetical protein